MIKKFLKTKVVAYFLVNIIKEKSIKHTARAVAEMIDKVSEKQFGEKASEKLQAKLEKGLQLFTDTVIKELRRDRK